MKWWWIMKISTFYTDHFYDYFIEAENIQIHDTHWNLVRSLNVFFFIPCNTWNFDLGNPMRQWIEKMDHIITFMNKHQNDCSFVL